MVVTLALLAGFAGAALGAVDPVVPHDLAAISQGDAEPRVFRRHRRG